MHAPDFVVESLILEAPQLLLVLVDKNATNATTWSAVVAATCANANATEERNRTYAFQVVEAAPPVLPIETVTSCLATNYGAPIQLVPTFTRAIRLNATEGVVEVAASVAGKNGTVSAKLTVELEALRGAHLMLPLPGGRSGASFADVIWLILHVENGSHVAAVLRVFNGEEEYACAAYDAQHGEEPRRRLLDSYGESLVRGRTGSTTTPSVRSLEGCRPACPISSTNEKWPRSEALPGAWRATAQRRFRSGEDAQYAFSYMHYVMETHDSYDVSMSGRCGGAGQRP